MKSNVHSAEKVGREMQELSEVYLPVQPETDAIAVFTD